MSAATMQCAGLLIPGDHAIRPPGETEFLTVEKVEIRRNEMPNRVYLTAGGRQFVTRPETYWPCEMAS